MGNKGERLDDKNFKIPNPVKFGCFGGILIGVLALTIWSINLDSQYKNATKEVANSKIEISAILKNCIKNKQEQVVINYKGMNVVSMFKDVSKLKSDVAKMAIVDIAEEEKSYRYFTVDTVSVELFPKLYDSSFFITIKYTETAEQEKYVDKKIDEIIGEIIKPEMTDDEKVKAIHDYITFNFTYNIDRPTAYEALQYGETRCSGFSMLTYKMLNKVGIENYIVNGIVKNGNIKHAWNLIKLNGTWYHTDLTNAVAMYEKSNMISSTYLFYNLSDADLGKVCSWNTKMYPTADGNYDAYLLEQLKIKKDEKTKLFMFSIGKGIPPDVYNQVFKTSKK